MLKPGTILRTDNGELLLVTAKEPTTGRPIETIECIRCEGDLAGTRCFVSTAAHRIGHISELVATSDRWGTLKSILTW